jgi:hypothetical protein
VYESRHAGRGCCVRRATNTLLTYLVPDIYYFLAGLMGLEYLGHFNAGWPGILRAIAFTTAVLLVAMGLTKARLRMQL